jgi:hypothetical protein
MYRIAYDPERWEQAQQYVLRDLDADRRLIAHLYLTDGGQVVVARAWIEQAYVTRRDAGSGAWSSSCGHGRSSSHLFRHPLAIRTQLTLWYSSQDHTSLCELERTTDDHPTCRERSAHRPARG